MAAQSSDPSNSVNEKSQISEVTQPGTEVRQDAKPEATNQISPKSVFVNSEPMREDQVQNAVKFLSHPRVRGSPVIHRRSFLENKGLTKEEIDEAFRRVPDPPPSSQATSFTQDGQQASPNVRPQSQTQTQAPQPVVAAPTVVTSSQGTLTNRRFHWYHAVMAVGLLVTSGVGTAVLIKYSIIPRLKSWVRRVVREQEESDSSKKPNAKPSLAEEATAAAKAAAAAAADVARASQEMMSTRNAEKRHVEEFMHLLDVQVQEMKSISNSFRKLEGQTNNPGRINTADQEYYGASFTGARRLNVNGKVDHDSHSARSSSPPTSVEPSMPPHPKSYMEIMEMVQRGEKPSNIREINDLPPNPNLQPSNPRIAPRTKPWDSASDSGVNYESESSAPWWQRKSPRMTEMEYESASLVGSHSHTIERPAIQQRTWVPPQPPPVAMPEAAEAIRRPKPVPKIDQEGDDQVVANGSGATDELQRITKVSELGGEVGINGSGSSLLNNEIQGQEHASD